MFGLYFVVLILLLWTLGLLARYFGAWVVRGRRAPPFFNDDSKSRAQRKAAVIDFIAEKKRRTG